MSALEVRAGEWSSGMPYLCAGGGRPLLFLPGLTPHHRVPTGLDRTFQVRQFERFARARQVWWVNRRPGLAKGVTIADLAADYATGIAERFDEPVDVLGVSTGGSIALQLAADHAPLIRKLILVSAACRLAPEGRAAQRAVLERLDQRDPRSAGAVLYRPMGTDRVTRALWSALGWALGPTLFADGVPDMRAVIEAEDRFDLTDRLPDISVPTLVIGGDRDGFITPEIFHETAEKLPNGTLRLYRHTGHVGVQTRPRFVPDILLFLNR